MASQRPLISVICCAHNEEEYVKKSIPSILSALKGFPAEVLFVADRCTDKTAELAERYGVEVINKTWKKWKNSYAESLQTGYLEAEGVYVSIIDADIAVPNNFFIRLLPFVRNRVASVAAEVVTYPDTFLNRLSHAWEKTYKISPFGGEPRGASRIILKKALDEIDGFRDVPAPDTDLDIRLAQSGYVSLSVSALKTFHLRHLSFSKIINRQLASGRARYELEVSFKRTLAHAVLRLRPFVLSGWLQSWSQKKR